MKLKQRIVAMVGAAALLFATTAYVADAQQNQQQPWICPFFWLNLPELCLPPQNPPVITIPPVAPTGDLGFGGGPTATNGSVDDLGDGGFRVDSFFDILPERANGGAEDPPSFNPGPASLISFDPAAGNGVLVEPGARPGDSLLVSDIVPAFSSRGPSDPCVPSVTTLCLGDDRFQIEIDWMDFTGNGGSGVVLPFAGGDTGAFSFFNDLIVDASATVIDTCGEDQGALYFYLQAMTPNITYEITITDTETGQGGVLTETPTNAPTALGWSPVFGCPAE